MQSSLSSAAFSKADIVGADSATSNITRLMMEMQLELSTPIGSRRGAALKKVCAAGALAVGGCILVTGGVEVASFDLVRKSEPKQEVNVSVYAYYAERDFTYNGSVGSMRLTPSNSFRLFDFMWDAKSSEWANTMDEMLQAFNVTEKSVKDRSGALSGEVHCYDANDDRQVVLYDADDLGKMTSSFADNFKQVKRIEFLMQARIIDVQVSYPPGYTNNERRKWIWLMNDALQDSLSPSYRANTTVTEFVGGHRAGLKADAEAFRGDAEAFEWVGKGHRVSKGSKSHFANESIQSPYFHRIHKLRVYPKEELSTSPFNRTQEWFKQCSVPAYRHCGDKLIGVRDGMPMLRGFYLTEFGKVKSAACHPEFGMRTFDVFPNASFSKESSLHCFNPDGSSSFNFIEGGADKAAINFKNIYELGSYCTFQDVESGTSHTIVYQQYLAPNNRQNEPKEGWYLFDPIATVASLDVISEENFDSIHCNESNMEMEWKLEPVVPVPSYNFQ